MEILGLKPVPCLSRETNIAAHKISLLPRGTFLSASALLLKAYSRPRSVALRRRSLILLIYLVGKGNNGTVTDRIPPGKLTALSKLCPEHNWKTLAFASYRIHASAK